MNIRRLLAVLTTATMAIAVFSFTRVTQPAAQSSKQGAQPPSDQSVQPEVPDEIAYRHLFRYVGKLKKEAEELEARGKDATSYRTHFKRAANLSEYHAEALDNIATQYLSEVQVVDARARQVIESYRAQYPGGKVPKGKHPRPHLANSNNCENNATPSRYAIAIVCVARSAKTNSMTSIASSLRSA